LRWGGVRGGQEGKQRHTRELWTESETKKGMRQNGKKGDKQKRLLKKYGEGEREGGRRKRQR
jgi:hypothetical protein